LLSSSNGCVAYECVRGVDEEDDIPDDDDDDDDDDVDGKSFSSTSFVLTDARPARKLSGDRRAAAVATDVGSGLRTVSISAVTGRSTLLLLLLLLLLALLLLLSSASSTARSVLVDMYKSSKKTVIVFSVLQSLERASSHRSFSNLAGFYYFKVI
jgi:hypothetical protein